jgi:hypothetical protein
MAGDGIAARGLLPHCPIVINWSANGSRGHTLCTMTSEEGTAPSEWLAQAFAEWWKPGQKVPSWVRCFASLHPFCP